MANTFLKAKGYEMGSSLFEDELVPIAKKMITQYGEKIHLPMDVVACNKHMLDINKNTEVQCLKPGEQAVDIGSKTIEHYAYLIKKAQTLMMNGPMGIFEDERFALGSRAIVSCIGEQTQKGKLFSLAGGGDTLALLEQEQQKNNFSFLSTGGGAFLACLEGTLLPGIEALMQ
jgi:phosphoglycerate kinase